MDWQIGIVSVIVVLAVAYLARQTWRTWGSAKGGCGGGCACSGRKTSPVASTDEVALVRPEELTLRPRRSNR